MRFPYSAHLDRILRPHEPLSSFSHLFGALLALVGTVLLIERAGSNGGYLAVSLLYGMSMVFLFTVSATLHATHRSCASRDLLERLDHIGIYAVIAATYTPVCLFVIKGSFGLALLIFQWLCAAIGAAVILTKGLGCIRISVLLYLAMGWSFVVALPTVTDVLNAENETWLFVGGTIYTLGAAVFVADWPHLKRGYVSAHDLWHVLVVVATTCHYMMIRGIMA